ncbi:MAG: TolC family protein [Verrucomicrobia bacterium]|nr:TolC family protein [Verrucomicrobiota bacterium]
MHSFKPISWLTIGLSALFVLSGYPAQVSFGQGLATDPPPPEKQEEKSIAGSGAATDAEAADELEKDVAAAAGGLQPDASSDTPETVSGATATDAAAGTAAAGELEGGLLGGLPSDADLVRNFELFLEEGTVAEDSAAAKLAREIIERESKRQESKRELQGISFSMPGDAELDAKTAALLKTISDRAISLEEALALTLLNDPNIKLANEDELIAWASLQIASGAYDVRGTAGASYGRTQQEVSKEQVDQQVKTLEKNKKIISDAQRVIRQRESEIDELRAGRTPSNTDIESQLNSEIRAAALDVIKRVSNPAEFFALASTQSKINEAGILVRKDIIRSQRRTIKSTEKEIEKFPVNSVLRSDTVSYELGLLRKLRTGPVINPFLTLNGSENNEARRRGVARDTRTEFGVELMLPLARGRGRVAASGQEIAAGHDLEASRYSLQHTVSESVLNTASAYWRVVAAQERLRILLESEIITTALVFVTDQMIAADAIPPIERAQIMAREATAQSSRVQGEFALVQAQQALAIAMGIEGDDLLYAPLASDPLPDLVSKSAISSTSPQGMVDLALQLRADRKSALQLEESGLVLTEQAKTNLRPALDFTSRTSYSGLDEGSHYESYYQPYLQGNAGPSYFMGLRFDYPIGNNTAKGLLKEREARLRQSKLTTGIITRSILSNIVTARKSIENSLLQIDSLNASRSALVDSLNAEQERFKTGDSTLLDTILTEERLTGANRAIIEAKLQHALGLAQLRFETGTLMASSDSSNAAIERRNVISLPDLGNYSKNPPPAPPAVQLKKW